MGKRRNHIIMFSGGLDSSLLADNLLSRATKDESNVNFYFVSLISNCILGENKVNREMKARKAILNEFKIFFAAANIQTIEIETDIRLYSTQDWPSGNTGLSQPIIWSLLSSMYFYKDDVVHIGYNKEDYSEALMESVKKLFKAVAEVQNVDGNKIVYQYDSIDLTKVDNLVYFVNKYNKDKSNSGKRNHMYQILEKFTCCESNESEDDNCGNCAPCRTLKETLSRAMIVDPGNCEIYHYMYEQRFGSNDSMNELIKLVREEEKKRK